MNLSKCKGVSAPIRTFHDWASPLWKLCSRFLDRIDYPVNTVLKDVNVSSRRPLDVLAREVNYDWSQDFFPSPGQGRQG